MPRSAAAVIENQFTAGLVTDATALSFPEHAVSDVDNCRFHQRGFVERRCGIDLEANAATRTFANNPGAYSSFVWKAAANTTTNIAVVQVGANLLFWSIGTAATSAGYIGSISLATYLPSGSAFSYADFECQYASGLGYLFVVHPYLDPFYVTFTPGGPSVAATLVKVLIRDFDGIDDGLGFDTTVVNNFSYPSSLSDGHKYNLYNQGWFNPLAGSSGGGDGTGSTTAAADYRITQYHTAFSKYPSNSEIWFTYVAPFVTGSTTYEIFSPTITATGLSGPSTRAPRGHYVLNAFNQDRSTACGIAGLTITTSSFIRPSTNAFYAGRVWYAGVQQQSFGNKIYFSQIVQTTDQIGLCHQQNDPTDKDFFNLLANDGGVVQIQDAGQILKLMVYGKFLLVFATNGVWSIGGSTGYGFTANDYSITKISAIPCISGTSFVDAGGTPMWWNEDGVYGIEPKNQSTVSFSDGKIKVLFDLIPYSCKQGARGVYNPVSKTVHWIFRAIAPSTTAQSYIYHHALNFNMVTGAFDTWTLPSSTAQIVGLFVVNQHIPEAIPTFSVNPTTLQTSYILSSITKFITIYPNGVSNKFLTFADERDTTFTDFKSVDNTGLDYTSYFVSGFQVHGEGQKKFQVGYVFLYTEKKDTPTSLFFSTRWDYSLDGNTGRWSPQELIVYPSTNFRYFSKKLRVNGHGKAVAFSVTSLTGQPFNIVGWSSSESTGSAP